jgi:putative Ca2+/H+ antiporter (TMEM165/GDT1 family)
MHFPNSETITGIALVFLSLLFIYAGLVNQAWTRIFIVDYVMIAIGGGFIALGVWTEHNDRKKRPVGPSHR